MGVRLAAARMEPLLLSPRRRGRHRLRPDGERQRCARSICAVGRREMARSQDDGRGCSAVIHHLPWDWRTRSGRSLWAELVHRYDLGVAAVDAMAATWDAQRAHVDAERFADVADDLRVQQREARWWRDASVAYWQSVNGLPLPEGAAPPAHNLAPYRALAFPEAPGI